MGGESKSVFDTLKGAIFTQKWKHPLFSCFDDPKLCCITFFCPCITVGRMFREIPGIGCLLAGLLCTVPVVNLFISYQLRNGIKLVKMINEDDMETLLIAVCCSCCAIIQEAKEIGSEDDNDSKESSMDRD